MKEKIFIVTGLVLSFTGILCNEWYLTMLLSPDGTTAVSNRIVIWITDIFLIGTGIISIVYRRSLTKESILFITGLLFILAGILFNERFLYILLKLDIDTPTRIIIWFVQLYVIVTGTFLIFYRKSIRFSGIFLYTFSTLFGFILLLSFDFYQAYAFLQETIRSKPRLQENTVHIKDPYLGWKLNPDGISKKDGNIVCKIDHNGFRKIDNSGTPLLSIYFLGDSFTFGAGVKNSETFTQIMKEKYFGNNIYIYNAGVMGYGMVQMFQLFSDIEKRIKPGDIIIFTPISEDIKRNLSDFYYPYLFFYTNLMQVQIEDYPVYDNGTITYHKLEDNLYHKMRFLSFLTPYTKNFWIALNKKFILDTTAESIKMIKIIKHRTEMKGAKFVLFFLPHPRECLRGSYDVDISGFNYYDIMRFFPRQKEELDKLQVSDRDHHWNVEGHKVAARGIVETLIHEKVLQRNNLKKEL